MADTTKLINQSDYNSTSELKLWRCYKMWLKQESEDVLQLEYTLLSNTFVVILHTLLTFLFIFCKANAWRWKLFSSISCIKYLQLWNLLEIKVVHRKETGFISPALLYDIRFSLWLWKTTFVCVQLCQGVEYRRGSRWEQGRIVESSAFSCRWNRMHHLHVSINCEEMNNLICYDGQL
jgi:hypothetical protein